LGRAFSSSYAPSEEPEARVWAEKLRELFGKYQRVGTVALHYQTMIYIAQLTP
jgi:hypothetical protein